MTSWGTRLDGIVYGWRVTGESLHVTDLAPVDLAFLYLCCLGRCLVEKGGWEDAASRDPNPTAIMELYKGVSIYGVLDGSWQLLTMDIKVKLDLTCFLLKLEMSWK